MYLGIVSAVYPPLRGGMATVTSAEARALAKLHDVTVFTLHESTVARSDDVPVVRMRAFPRISLGGCVPQLFFHLLKCDVVYAHLPAYGFMTSLLLWKLITRRRLIVTLHMDPVGTGWRRVAFAVLRPWLRVVLRAADVVRVSSGAFARAPILKGLSSVEIIPFGIDGNVFCPRGVYEARDNAALFVGRLSRTHYFKGVRQLLEAFARVPQPTALWIVGDGNLRASYEQHARALGIADRVIFFGALSDDALRARYARARVTVLTSTDSSETFGMVLLEAMASGCPVIASQLPGVDQVVRHNQTGLLVPPTDVAALADALTSLLNDPVRAVRFSIAARSHALTYASWGVVAERLSGLL